MRKQTTYKEGTRRDLPRGRERGESRGDGGEAQERREGEREKKKRSEEW